MKEILYEYRTQLVRPGSPVLAPEPIKNAQFRSVYGYPPEIAHKIKKQASTKGLNQSPVYSDTLLIDVDKEGNLEKAQKVLKGLSIKYQLYSTGNREGHIHVPIAPIMGTNVVYSQKQWLKLTGLWPLIDSSIYHPAGQFRCIGATHRKTGRKKELLETVDGKTLSIPTLTPPPIVHNSWETEEGTSEQVFDWMMNLLAKRGNGRRRPHLYILSKAGKRAGLDRAEVEECMRWWNDRQDQPLDKNVINQKIRELL